MCVSIHPHAHVYMCGISLLSVNCVDHHAPVPIHTPHTSPQPPPPSPNTHTQKQSASCNSLPRAAAPSLLSSAPSPRSSTAAAASPFPRQRQQQQQPQLRRLLSSRGLEVFVTQQHPLPPPPHQQQQQQQQQERGEGEGASSMSSSTIRTRPRGLSEDAADGLRAWAEGRERLVVVGGSLTPARRREGQGEEEGEQQDFVFSRSKSDSLVAVPPNLASD
jgi:hypothetical protein